MEEEEGFKADAVNWGSFERRCWLITDDADLVEISSVFRGFVATKRKRERERERERFIMRIIMRKRFGPICHKE